MFTWSLTEVAGGVLVRARGEGDEQMVGDFAHVIPEGESMMGAPYAWVLERARTVGHATVAEIEAAAHD